MRRHLRNPWVWVAAALLFAVWLFWPRTVNSPAPGEAPPPASAPAAAGAGGAVELRAHRCARPARLPAAEARDTVALILRGGPFPHPQDGSVFGNRERRLPDMPRGYYHEYTVDTPGLASRRTPHRHRRAAAATWYYTDDHYDSFRTFEVGRTQ